MKTNSSFIHTKRLLLRAFTDDDLDNIFKGLSHADVIRYYGVSYTTKEETKLQLQFFTNIELQATGKWWAVCSADNRVFYGGCGLNNIDKQNRKGEIGYWLLPEYWGKGIISEAIPIVCRYGFEQFRLHRIEAIIEAENENSKKVMQKAGFDYEGTMKEREYKNGRFISIDVYGLLNNTVESC